MIWVDINVSFDGANKAWTVNMNKRNKKLKTFIEPVDVNECIEDRHLCYRKAAKESGMKARTCILT